LFIEELVGLRFVEPGCNYMELMEIVIASEKRFSSMSRDYTGFN